MKKPLLIAILAFNLAGAQVHALPIASRSAGDQIAALAAARDLLIASGFEGQMEKVGMSMANAAFEQSLKVEESQKGQTLPDDLKQRIRAVMNDEVAAMLGDMKQTTLDDAAHIYADHFTADELRRLMALNQDPVMRKAQSLMPQMIPQLAQIGMKAAAERKSRLEQRVKDTFKEWTGSQKNKGTSL